MIETPSTYFLGNTKAKTMNISKSSWHYRVLDKLDMLSAWHDETLCLYFWKVVVVVVFAPLIIGGVTWLVTVPFWWSFFSISLAIAILIGVIEIAGLSIWLKILVSTRHEAEIEAGTRVAPRPKPYKPPSLLRLWLKARHEQICPIIEFTDHDD